MYNKDDLETCYEIIKKGSHSFYAASRILPRKVRDSAIVLYSFCRIVDDAIDDMLPAGTIESTGTNLMPLQNGELAAPQNAIAATNVIHPTSIYPVGRGSSSSHPGPGFNPVPGDGQFVQNNFVRQTNNLEFLQQQLNIAITTADPKVIFEASQAVLLAQQETQAVQAQASAVINNLDNELQQSKTNNAALLKEGQSLQQNAARAINDAVAQKDAVARDASVAVSQIQLENQALRDQLARLQNETSFISAQSSVENQQLRAQIGDLQKQSDLALQSRSPSQIPGSPTRVQSPVLHSPVPQTVLEGDIFHDAFEQNATDPVPSMRGSPAQQFDIHSGISQNGNPRFCIGCGKRLTHSGAKFCDSCGTPIPLPKAGPGVAMPKVPPMPFGQT